MVTATKDELIPEAYREVVRLRLLDADDLQGFPDDDKRYEIIGGKLIVSPSPNSRHQRISFELAGALYLYLKQGGDGVGFSAQSDVHLSPTDVVQPDILVVLREHQSIILDQGIYGAPDLVVEVLSPSSAATDFLRKSHLYERFGVPEYWIVDPIRESVIVQTLVDGHYAVGQELGRGDTLRSTVLDGFELGLATIFPEPAEPPKSQPSVE